MMKLGFLALAALTASSPLSKRVSGTSTVNLGNNTGTPAHLASGILYGIPDASDQIPDHFYTDFGFNYGRAGGSQISAPGRGWIWGPDEYNVRFASALSNYKTARKYDADFVWLFGDLWGADGSQNSSAPYPGDDGDWSSWDEFLTYWVSNVTSNDALAGLAVDIWNEPDGTYFWNREQSQWLEFYGRTYHRLRTDLPDALLLGPTLASPPDTSDSWWTGFMSFISTNASVPDQFVWHEETGGGDLESHNGQLQLLLDTYDVPRKPINIDEYAIYAEQCPAGSAWFISQLERVDAHGLRGNWLGGDQLHDFLASLLSKPNASTSSYSYTEGGYFPNGDYQVYKYYNLNMTGYRVGTEPSADLAIDTYAVVGTSTVRILTGVRITTGTWQITVDNLSAVGLSESGSLDIHTWGFPFTGGHFGEVDAPDDLGWYSHDYSGNSVTFPIYQTDTSTAYAFEFSI